MTDFNYLMVFQRVGPPLWILAVLAPDGHCERHPCANPHIRRYLNLPSHLLNYLLRQAQPQSDAMPSQDARTCSPDNIKQLEYILQCLLIYADAGVLDGRLEVATLVANCLFGGSDDIVVGRCLFFMFLLLTLIVIQPDSDAAAPLCEFDPILHQVYKYLLVPRPVPLNAHHILRP